MEQIKTKKLKDTYKNKTTRIKNKNKKVFFC